MRIKVRFLLAFLVLVNCISVNFLAMPPIYRATYGYGGVLMASVAELLGSIAIPFAIFLILVIYKMLRGVSISLQTFEYFIWTSVAFALMHSVLNLNDAIVNVVSH
jgi:hypothetical protein